MKRKTIVIKYGSTSVVNGSGMDMGRIQGYAKQLAQLSSDFNLVVVSSGSVATGRALWGQAGHKGHISAQSLAMLGSGEAFVAWQKVLLDCGLLSGQLLVTHREVDDPTEGPSVRAVIEQNNAAGIITIVNENDALSDIELAKLSYGGDNDGLAAHIATKVGAWSLCLMTDKDGLLNSSFLVRTVGADEAEWAAAKGYCATKMPLGSLGRGSMLSKVEAATGAAKIGIDTYIANANADIHYVLSGNIGTHFEARIIPGTI